MKEKYLKIKAELITSELSDIQFRILLYLIFKSRKQKCFPSIRTLASELKKSTTSIQKTLNELEKQGYLTKENRKTKSGKTTSNEYELNENLFVKRKKADVIVSAEIDERIFTEDELKIFDYDWMSENEN